jgi:hypothetical protein
MGFWFRFDFYYPVFRVLLRSLNILLFLNRFFTFFGFSTPFFANDANSPASHDRSWAGHVPTLRSIVWCFCYIAAALAFVGGLGLTILFLCWDVRVTYANAWTLLYFALTVYLISVFSVMVYLVAQTRFILPRNRLASDTQFFYISGLLLLPTLLAPLFLIFLIAFVWVGPSLSTWFGHLLFAGFQAHFTYVILATFILVWISYATSFYFTSVEVYDYVLVTYSFFMWTLLLFYSNNIFSVIFFIEILSTLVTLLFITSIFSSGYFFNHLSLTRHSYFDQSTPLAFTQTLLFFFWISLLASLNLFIFLILFYLKFATLDWYTLEVLAFYIFATGDLRDFFSMSLIWLTLMFCIFLKCGLVPFYFWKPVFFKGISLHTLFFYVFFYYFAILYFFIYFTLVYVSDLFYANIFINNLLLMAGVVMLVFILCESYYLKAFFALSSILNTLLVFLMMSSCLVLDLGVFCIGL